MLQFNLLSLILMSSLGSQPQADEYTARVRDYQFTLLIGGEVPLEGQEDSWWGGTSPRVHGGKPPVRGRPVLRLDGFWHKQPIFIMASVWAGLADVRKVSIRKYTPRSCDLTIEGGDTSTFYIATIHFDRGAVVSRIVRLDEFRYDVWEKTEYHFDPKIN